MVRVKGTPDAAVKAAPARNALVARTITVVLKTCGRSADASYFMPTASISERLSVYDAEPVTRPDTWRTDNSTPRAVFEPTTYAGRLYRRPGRGSEDATPVARRANALMLMDRPVAIHVSAPTVTMSLRNAGIAGPASSHTSVVASEATYTPLGAIACAYWNTRAAPAESATSGTGVKRALTRG